MKIDAIRETSVSGTSVTVRKAAYCDMHTPHDADMVSIRDEEWGNLPSCLNWKFQSKYNHICTYLGPVYRYLQELDHLNKL